MIECLFSILKNTHNFDDTARKDFSFMIVRNVNISNESYSNFKLLLKNAYFLFSLMT